MLVVTFCIIVETRTAIVTSLLRTAVVATLWTAITTATAVTITAATTVAVVATLWTAIATTAAAAIAAALWTIAAARITLQASSESFWTEATLATAVTTSIAAIRWAMTVNTWTL